MLQTLIACEGRCEVRESRPRRGRKARMGGKIHCQNGACTPRLPDGISSPALRTPSFQLPAPAPAWEVRGGLAWSALSAAEEHTGGTVADRTFVGRSVVVLLASREVRSGKIFDGALIFLLQCFYSFSFFSRRGGGGERA